MITYMIITVFFFSLLGLGTLSHAIKRAATGYEDDFGFHEGTDPQTEMVFAAAVQTSVAGGGERIRSRRLLKRASKQKAGQASSFPA